MSGKRLHEQAPAERWITANSTERTNMLRWELGANARNPKQLDAVIGTIRSHGLLLDGSFEACVEMGKHELAEKRDFVTRDGLRRHEVHPEETRQVQEIVKFLEEQPPIFDPKHRGHRPRGYHYRFRTAFVR